MMFASTYSFDCPLCKETYNSGKEIILASGREQAGEAVIKKHRKCPLCGESLEGQELEITILAGN